MANPNTPPPPTPQNSVEDGIYRSLGGAWLGRKDLSADGGPGSFAEKRTYGWTIVDDPRARHVATMTFGSAGANHEYKKTYLPEYAKDKNGKYKLDEDGKPIPVYKRGKPVYKLDKDGRRIPIYDRDNSGNLKLVTPSQNMEDGFRKRYKTTADGMFAINPRSNLNKNHKGEDSNPYKPRRVEGWIDGKPQAAAANVGRFVLDSVKHLFGQKTHHAHHRHYTRSTGLERYDEELERDKLPANYDAHPDIFNDAGKLEKPGLFNADALEKLNKDIDNAIVQERIRLKRLLTPGEANTIRSILIYDYTERGKNAKYPNTAALREMVGAQARIERRRLEDINAAKELQAARSQAMKDAKRAADLQNEANEATLRMDERSEDEVLNAEDRHQELLGELRGNHDNLLDELRDNNDELLDELHNNNQDLLDKLHDNHGELLEVLEDKILAELIDVKEAVKDMPDLKKAFDDYLREWRADTKKAGTFRSDRIQADRNMLLRLDDINAKLRDANTHAAAQTAAAQAQAKAAADQATATAAQAFAMRDQATAAAEQARTLQDIADELKKRPAAPTSATTDPATGAPSVPYSTPTGPHKTPDMNNVEDAEIVDEDAGATPRAIGSTPHTPEASDDQSNPDH